MHERAGFWILAAGTAAAPALLSPGSAFAAALPLGIKPFIDPDRIVFLAALIGVVGFAVLSAVALIRARNRAEVENGQLRNDIADLKAGSDRAEALLDRDDQRIVLWAVPSGSPFLFGRLPDQVGAPAERAGFLAFGTWLRPESAGRLDRAVARLRERGEAFTLTLATVADRLVESQGRTIGSSVAVYFRELSGDRLARAEVTARYELLAAEVDALRALLSAASMPIWLRDNDGRLVWVNRAYAAAVDAASEADAVERGLEFLDTNGRRTIEAGHREAAVFDGRLPVIVSGNRHVFSVVDVVSATGSAGIGIDVTAIEAAEAALRREVAFNARILDELATAVAVFGSDRRLRSYNAAYCTLFGLDAAYLDTNPDEATLLDRLRAAGKLPEQADFRNWRAEVTSAYRALEPRQYWWHLPDSRTLRVIANPNPQGGVTWIYENVTERLDLESRYNALIQVQGETLDHLSEGVAVFGSDGRLRLNNPSFADIWDIPDDVLVGRPHVAEVVDACRRPGDDGEVWRRFTAAVAGLDENRSPQHGRMERAGGRVIDYATVPLPDGQTMVTFVDVTDTVKVERALIERNEALEAADSLKNAFVQHVSYELRSPLTNIIGFAQLLAESRVGPLTAKQREYAGYILSSSGSLLALVNDILDLATIDAGIMELDYSEVDIAETVAAAIEGVRERVRASEINLETMMPPDIGRFVADQRRVRQILYNLLSNAVTYSAKGGHITVAARRDGDMVEFTVADEGAGFPEDFLDRAFERFAAKPRPGVRGGAGLGLSIVKSFVDLHGGSVAIRSKEGAGATVVCRFPVRPGAVAAAAE
jgi:signal transduction histidine kinase